MSMASIAESLASNASFASLASRQDRKLSDISDKRIQNMVFMGMGEPMDNYDGVAAAIRSLCNNNICAMAKNKLCVSTVGVVPNMRRLFTEMPTVKLAISLHAANQKLRETIMPIARKYHMDELI